MKGTIMVDGMSNLKDDLVTDAYLDEASITFTQSGTRTVIASVSLLAPLTRTSRLISK